MVLTAICFAVAVLSLPLVLRMKRIRDQREMEQFSITAEELLLT
jgi:multisubunit Na+/H+ antiporter MnhC subunit